MNILRIANTAGHTSSPLYSFTLVRSRLYDDEETTFLAYAHADICVDAVCNDKLGHDISEKYNIRKYKVISARGSVLRYWEYILSWTKKVRMSGKKSIIHLHGPGPGFVFALLRKIACSEIPVVYTVHSSYMNYTLKHKIFMMICFEIADKVTFVSNCSYESFPKRLLRKPLDKYVIIRNGVDIDGISDKINKRRYLINDETNKIRLISIGRCVYVKNQKYLLDVLENIKGEWVLDIYGDGSLLGFLKKEVISKGLSDRVNFKGVVSREDVFEALLQGDIFLSSSLWEGLPIALMEAMCVGLPCILSDIPSHREVGEGCDGIFLCKQDLHEWRNQLVGLAEMSQGQRRALGKKNQDVIEQKFSVRIMQEKYRELYASLIG